MAAENEKSLEAHRSVWHDMRSVAFEQGWVDVDGVSTRYWRAGDPRNPNLVFLHGTGGHVEAFARNIRAHAEHYQVWAIDMVGHGWTDLTDHDLEIDHYVEHVRGFLDAKNIDRAALAGVSLGGWVASRFAISYPDRVTAMVLNTPGGSQSDSSVMTKIRRTTSSAVDTRSWESVRARLEYLVFDPTVVHDDLVATRMEIYGRPGMKANTQHVLALQNEQIRARNLISAGEYGSIASPTLIVWTDHDPTAPVGEGARIAGMIPGARFVVIPNSAHWPQFENAEEYNHLSLDFLGANVTELARR